MQPHLYVRLRLRVGDSRRRVVVSHRACREVVSYTVVCRVEHGGIP
jgi:hypothetical protein